MCCRIRSRQRQIGPIKAPRPLVSDHSQGALILPLPHMALLWKGAYHVRSKQKRGKSTPLLDFVTIRSLDECCDVLQRIGGQVHEETDYGDPQFYFMIAREAVRKKYGTIDLQLMGTLNEVATGTHVVGAITESSWQEYQRWQADRILSLLAVALVYVVAVLLAPDVFLRPLFLVGYILLVVVASVFDYQKIARARRIPRELAIYVYAKLYALPDRKPKGS